MKQTLITAKRHWIFLLRFEDFFIVLLYAERMKILSLADLLLHELVGHKKKRYNTRVFLRHVRYHNYRFLKNLPVKPAFFPGRAALVLNFFATAQSGQSLYQQDRVMHSTRKSGKG